MTAPQTLDHAGIAARIPHAGRMCLLDRLLQWSDDAIACTSAGHRAPDHPLRSAGGLLAPCAIEMAAQAMALHGALRGSGAPRAGYLASVREVRMAVARLDGIAGDLQVRAERLAGDATQLLYRFTVGDAHGAVLVEGRAAVVLNAAGATP